MVRDGWGSLLSVVEATDSLDGGGAVDRGRAKHGGRPLVADASDELAVGWRQGAGVGRECHGILLGHVASGISRVRIRL